MFVDILKTIFLGIVEGITEWLPISSTGHMILVEQVVQFEFSEAFVSMFRVVIQLGAILAVVLLYFDRLWPFKKLPAGTEEGGTLPQKILKSMINQTIFAVSTSDVRPIYTGTLFEIEGKDLTLVSVDGYRLAKRSEKIEGMEMESCSFVVPGSALSDIERICADDEDNVSIAVGAKHISFSIGETVVVTRRLEGEFLNYRKSIPDKFRFTLQVDRSEFMSTIDRVALIVSEKNSSPVRLSFNDGTIDCLCVTPIGKAEDVCTCEGSGEGLEIGFNDRYLMDALKAAAGTDKLNICLNTASSPCIIEAADGSGAFTYMILPVRLREGD